MIDEAVSQAEQLEIAALKLKLPSLAIKANEKIILENLQDILRPFKEASQILCGSKYPTSSIIVPTVYAISSQLSAIEDLHEETEKAKEEIQNEVNQRLIPYVQNPICLMSTYLDQNLRKKYFLILTWELLLMV